MARANNTDWWELAQEAAAQGDYAKAAQYEQERNNKIDTLGLDYEKTNQYTQYLVPETNPYQPLGTYNDAGLSAADMQAVAGYQDQYRYGKATGNQEMMDTAHQAAEILRSQYGYSGGVDGSDYIALGGSGGGSGGSGGSGSNWPTFDYDAYKDRPTYESSYSETIDQLLDKILNREDFSYNFEEDPLYQQYLSQYTREGNRAMNDTLATAAANAGGMNSYAITAAQQANNYYAAQAADKIPELYQLAYEMYLDDIDLQVQDLGLVQRMDDTQYGRYRDTMSDWEDDRNFAYNAYRDDVSDFKWQTEFDYNVGRDQIADSRYDKEWNYSVSKTNYDKVMGMLAAGIMPNDDLLQSAGISRDTAAAITGTNTSTSNSTSSYYGDNSNITNYDNGGLTDAQIREMQDYYGANADGKWGANSKDAAGGLSADEAWAEYQKAKEEEKPKEITEDDVAAAVNALGIGMVDMDTVQEIMNFRGIIESGGKFVWINGWSKENWQSKLAENRERQNFIMRNTK